MKINIFILFILFLRITSFSQQNEKLKIIEKGFLKPTIDAYNVEIKKGEIHQYIVSLDTNQYYEFIAEQKGIDIVIKLFYTEKEKYNDVFIEQDSPNGAYGLESFDLIAKKSGNYFLQIQANVDSFNTNSGIYDLYINKLTTSQSEWKKKCKLEIEKENNKNIQTLDIDHFWSAYDTLKYCKTQRDSIKSFIRLYLNVPTNGLTDFLIARNFTADEYVEKISKYPKFFKSIRTNTLEVKKSEIIIQQIFEKFKEIYIDFNSPKVCFAIGTLRTGGTISDKYILIGSEITTSTNLIDLFEFNKSQIGKILAKNDNVYNVIKYFIAHEAVHTQQGIQVINNNCDLLNECLKEGSCDFIGELLGCKLNSIIYNYGIENEEKLIQEFNKDMCRKDISKWLYNANQDSIPSDLGYFIGYRISQLYYNNLSDKKQAIKDILEMKDPINILERSKFIR